MPPKGSDLIFDHRHDAADRVLLDCRGAGILVRRAHRTGPVTPTVKLGAGHGAGVGRSAGRDALMPPRLEDGLRDFRAVGRVPRDRGRSGGRTPARAHPACGLRLAAGPRNVGAAARRVRTLPAVTLSDTGGQEERTRYPPYLHPPVTASCRFGLVRLWLRWSAGWLNLLSVPDSCRVLRAGGRVTGARSARAAAPQAPLTRPSGSGLCRRAGGREFLVAGMVQRFGRWPSCAG